MSATGIELFSAQVCPYSHRTRLALAEKGLDFDLIEIDIDARETPLRFRQVSPYGRVPALLHAGNQLYESNIINIYLDEAFPEPPLLPTDIGKRAQLRIWMDYFDNHFLLDWYRAIKNQESEKFDSFKRRIDAHFQMLEDAIVSTSGGGPYWFGSQITLLDIAIYPFFERIPAWAHYRGIEFPDRCSHLRAWHQIMLERPSVQSEVGAPEFYIQGYEVYAHGSLVL